MYCLCMWGHYPANISSIFLYFPWRAVSSCEEWVRSNGGDLPTSSFYFWQRRSSKWKGQSYFAFVYGSFCLLFLMDPTKLSSSLITVQMTFQPWQSHITAHFWFWLVHCLMPKYSLNADIPLSITHTYTQLQTLDLQSVILCSQVFGEESGLRGLLPLPLPPYP